MIEDEGFANGRLVCFVVLIMKVEEEGPGK